MPHGRGLSGPLRKDLHDDSPYRLCGSLRAYEMPPETFAPKEPPEFDAMAPYPETVRRGARGITHSMRGPVSR